MKIKENIAISESGFVFDSNTGESYHLNATGQLMMKLMQEEKTEEEIQQEILAEYEVDADTLSLAYYDFSAMLVQFNLLENED